MNGVLQDAVRARPFNSNFGNLPSVKKSKFSDVLVLRLGLRRGRLNSLVQRAAELGQLPMAVGTHYPQLEPVELARMLLLGICDRGLASAGSVIVKYGGLPGRGATLEQSLGHALTRALFAPSCGGLEIHTNDDEPYAVLSTITADGPRIMIFGEMPEVESVDRLVNISGVVLFAIASEVAGRSAVDVDAMLAGTAEMQPRSEVV